MPEPLERSYDMRQVLANLQNIYLENRQLVAEQRARQQRIFQAAVAPSPTQQQPTPNPSNTPSGSENPGGVSTIDTSNATGSPNPYGTIGGPTQGRGGSGYTPWTNPMPSAGNLITDMNNRNPTPILWGQGNYGQY